MLPRGIANNNPGNIRKGNDKWHGLSAVQFDKSFCTFDDAKWGIRAIIKIIQNYYRLNANTDTIRAIIDKWAPPVENDTGSYVDHVSEIVGVSPDDEINLMDKTILTKIAQGITLHENGHSENENTYWYPDSTFAEAVDLAAT